MDLDIGGAQLKNKSLSIKIMFYYGLMSALLIVIIFTNLKEAFYDYYYDDIFNMLSSVLNESDTSKVTSNFLGNDLSNPYKIQVLIFDESDENITSLINENYFSEPSKALISRIKSDLIAQENPIKNYILEIDDNMLFYVIKRDFEILSIGSNTYKRHIVALRWNTSNTDLKKNLLSRAIIVIIFSFFIMLTFSYLASRMITYPLSNLVKSVKCIGNRNLTEPIQIWGDDEISEMGYAIEDMRQKLSEYEKHEKFKLHSISHELKTPIMIIKSYLECFRTNQYINDDKIQTINIIQNECDSMQHLINDLLTIQKLDYASVSKIKFEQLNLSTLIDLSYERYKSPSINFINSTGNLLLNINSDQINMLFTNIFSNQIRYAKSKIIVDGGYYNSKAKLTIYNDGEHIKNIDKIFDIFYKGENGNTGLGLYICKKIMDLYNGSIEANNVDDGVVFTICFPVQ